MSAPRDLSVPLTSGISLPTVLWSRTTSVAIGESVAIGFTAVEHDTLAVMTGVRAAGEGANIVVADIGGGVNKQGA